MAVEHPTRLYARLASKLRVDESGCWVWTGHRRPDGYGLCNVAGAPRMVHRIVYEAVFGAIPDETLDHLCRNKACANPAHMEPVSRRENTLRSENPPALNARKERCPKCGGDFEQRTDSKRRICRTCFGEYAREYQRDARREQAAADGRAVAVVPGERTHCPKGHPYAGENLVTTKRGRGCRECNRARCLANYHNRRKVS